MWCQDPRSAPMSRSDVGWINGFMAWSRLRARRNASPADWAF
jgi:hypothetical protein